MQVNMKSNIKIIVLTIVLSLSAVGSAVLAQNKVVVIPLGSESAPVDPRSLVTATAFIDNPVTITSGFGIASAVRNSAGDYTLTLEQPSIGKPVIIATSFALDPDDEIITVGQFGSGNTSTFDIGIVDKDGNPTDSAFYVVVYGQTVLSNSSARTAKSVESSEVNGTPD